MKKSFIFLIALFLLVFLTACLPTPPTVAVLPLDNRPCNTVESQLLAQSAGKRMLLPPDRAPDYGKPASREAYWHWLDRITADAYIIYTNGLLNGGLMASRHLDTYSDMDAFLQRMETWLRDRSDKSITLVTVLPRMAPSQFDAVTSPYSQDLVRWGADYDLAASKNAVRPQPPEGIPAAVSQRYADLYAQNLALCEALVAFEEEGLCDAYLVALDDNAVHCMSRTVLRDLGTLPKEPIVNGADELTAMLVTRQPTHVPLALHYTDPLLASSIPEYEGQSLMDTVQEKCAFMGFEANPDASLHLIIHNTPGKTETIETILSEIPNDHRIGIADVAYTNKGDPLLWPMLSQKPHNLIAYSGWNTAANSLGTTLAACRSYTDHAPERENAAFLNDYVKLRLSIDQGYLAHLAPELKSQWYNRGLIDANGVFTDDTAKEICTNELNEAFLLWAEPLQLPSTSHLYFPWMRTFEAGFTK